MKLDFTIIIRNLVREFDLGYKKTLVKTRVFKNGAPTRICRLSLHARSLSCSASFYHRDKMPPPKPQRVSSSHIKVLIAKMVPLAHSGQRFPVESFDDVGL